VAEGRRAGLAAAPPSHPAKTPGPGEEAVGLEGVAQGPPGGRDGGVHGRGGREPEPQSRVHVDAAGPTGRRRDAGEQPEAISGREHPLADRPDRPDRGPTKGGAECGPVLSAPGRPAAGVPSFQGHPCPMRQRRDAHGRRLEAGPGVPGGVGAPGEGPLPAEVRPGHEPHRAGVVAAARGRYPEPSVPEYGRAVRPHLRLVRDPHPLPGPILGVHEMPGK
jgi:hypothetical protein